MMGTLRRSNTAVSQSALRPEILPRVQPVDVRGRHAAAARPTAHLVERVRTFVDRTLDAAFGRFDL